MMPKVNVSRWIAIAFIATFILACLSQTFFFSRAINLNEHFCSIHQRSTHFGVCKISYGEETPDKQENAAKSELFPLSNSCLNAGCMKGEDGYWKYTLYCPDCRRAERAWWIANRKKFAERFFQFLDRN